MAALVRFDGTDDLAEIIEALHAAADTRDETAPEQALRWRWLANDLGDALDGLPRPSHTD